MVSAFIGSGLCIMASAFTVVCTLRPVHIRSIFWLSMSTAPVLSVVFLLVFGVVSIDDVAQAIEGDDHLKPYTIVILFEALAYVGLAVDEAGVLRYAADAILDRASSSYRRLFLAVFFFCSVQTVLASNDTVVLTMTPIICRIAAQLKVDPIPILFAEFLVANTTSSLLIISNPTNVIVGTAFAFNFNTYFAWMAIPSLIGTLTLLPAVLFFFRSRFPSSKGELPEQLGYELEQVDHHVIPDSPFDQREVSDVPSDHLELSNVPTDQREISDMPFESPGLPDTPFAVASVVILALTILTLVVSPFLKLDIWVICLAFGVVMLILNGVQGAIRGSGAQPAVDVIRRMPWNIVPFVFGMFILVQGLSVNGFVGGAATILADIVGGAGLIPAILFVMVLSTIACNLMNNQPMTILFVSIFKHPMFQENLIGRLGAADADTLIRAVVFALIIGSNLGANLSMIGSLAGIMWTKILHDEFQMKEVTPGLFARAGLFCMGPVILTSGLTLALQLLLY